MSLRPKHLPLPLGWLGGPCNRSLSASPNDWIAARLPILRDPKLKLAEEGLEVQLKREGQIHGASNQISQPCRWRNVGTLFHVRGDPGDVLLRKLLKGFSTDKAGTNVSPSFGGG
jgi:hypothetical protein